MEMEKDLRDAYRGCMAGFAVGDAIGMPFQEMTRDSIRELYPAIKGFTAPHENHPLARLSAGQYTDDTQLLMAVADALIEGEGFNPHKMKNHLVEWYNNADQRLPGKANITAIARLDAGESYKDSGVEDAANAGSAKRAVPFGLVFTGDELIKYAYAQSVITHKTKRAAAGSVLVAHVVDRLLSTVELSPSDFIDSLARFAMKLEAGFKFSTSEFSDRITEMDAFLKESYSAGAMRFGTSPYVCDVVCTALFAFLYSPRDYARTVTAAVSRGGASDTIGALAGAFSGAYNGLSGIPAAWVSGLEDSRKILLLADGLYSVRRKQEG